MNRNLKEIQVLLLLNLPNRRSYAKASQVLRLF